jgi:hypothetical protein
MENTSVKADVFSFAIIPSDNRSTSGVYRSNNCSGC